MNPKLPGRSPDPRRALRWRERPEVPLIPPDGPSSASPPRCCATVRPPAAAGTAPSPAADRGPAL